ncbi:nucleotidyltransferase domain-containing protein [Sediminibacterium sp.]|uniref:nucleotidyltransferase domain-containing protein n=1 Tax=Sediminibacterium sp. TaxID=1917865 RepID=UPI002735C148|nr:nucleotidyltransferase domain-containing protein [Sediminibacterium sp.]MDP3566399.1 nucleotidyltransferase domain-containing protein [Sediminibacterium sp.]
MLNKIFTSKTRVKILTLFLMNPENEMFIREISRRIDENINAVRRELSNLENIGLLISKNKGNMKYYIINKDFSIYPELKSIILKTEGVSKVIKNDLINLGNIELAFIYGSFASGKDNLSSDLDIFLVGDIKEDPLIKELSKLEKTLSREINYVLFNKEEFDKRIKEEDPFISNVLNEPKIIILKNLEYNNIK